MIVYSKGPGIQHQRRERAKGSQQAIAHLVSSCASIELLLIILPVDTEELSHRESFLPGAIMGLEENQAEVDDEFIRSSPYPPPARQRFAAYCVFNGRLTGVFRTWLAPFFLA
jgi:hypothetical protein